MATWDPALEILTTVREYPSDGVPILRNADAEDSFYLDVAADALGRLGVVTGVTKLAQQVVLALTERRMAALLGTFTLTEFETLATERLKQLRASQMRFVAENDPSSVGFDVAKLDRRSGKYVRLNGFPITDTFTDASVVPGVTYAYSVGRRASRDSDRSTTIELLELEVPLAGSELSDFTSCAVKVERGAITFSFPQNRTFRLDEMLAAVLSINARIGADPRQVVVSLALTNALGNRVDVSTTVPVFDPLMVA